MTKQQWVGFDQFYVFAGYSLIVANLPRIARETGLPAVLIATMMHGEIVRQFQRLVSETLP